MALRKIQSSNRELMQVQEAVEFELKSILRSQILDGVLVTGLAVTTTATKFEHMLNRQPLGWIIVDKTGSASIYRTAWDRRTISLIGSGSDTISIWIF